MKNTKFTLVEDELNIYDDRFWYYIPSFNGYEISNDGYVRSMKHYKKYPFGLLIQPKKDRNGNIINPEDPIYELSTNYNERVSVNRSYLKHLADTNEYHITGYPRRTCIVDIAPRNQSCFIKKEGRFLPKFNIIREDKQEYNSLNKEERKIICPIESINNPKEYYGRDKSIQESIKIWQKKL